MRLLLLVLGTVFTVSSAVGVSGQVLPAGEVELARLIDLTAQRLGLSIDYDASAVRGSVTLRSNEAVTDEQLWRDVNRLLAARGLTTVQPDAEGSLSVVRLEAAASLSRIWWDAKAFAETGEPRPGFATVAFQPTHAESRGLATSITPLLSKPGGKAEAIPSGDFVLISDLTPRIDQILEAFALIDAATSTDSVEEIPTRFLAATRVVALANEVITKQKDVTGRSPRGQLIAGPDDRSVLVIATSESLPAWKDLIDRLDRMEPTETRVYTSASFPMEDVASLIESAMQGRAPGDGQTLRIVRDELTGSLIVTATAVQHAEIAALLERLEQAPPESRSTIRTFVIRNRPVDEVLEVIATLIEAGVLEAGQSEEQPPARETQVTRRDIQPPDAAASKALTGTVQPAARSLEAEHLTLTSDPGTNRILAIGEPRLLQKLESLITEIDVRQPQVVLEVFIVSLTEGQTMDLGVELERIGVSGDVSYAVSSLFGLSSGDTASGRTSSGQGFTGVVLEPGAFSVIVRALETLNHGRSLSAPKLLVGNNQEAVLDSVLQQPFTSTNASDTVATTSFGGTQDAGTTVTIRPQIAEGDHLVLEYSVSLSSFVGESADASLPPPRQQNQIQSVATIPDGYTIAVGGLEFTSDGESTSQVPLAARIPLIGELFKNHSNSGSRSRFYVFIRANVLRETGFEDLKYLSDLAVREAGIDDGWPEVEPRLIR